MSNTVTVPRWAIGVLSVGLALFIPWMSWQTVLLTELKTNMSHVRPVVIQFSTMQREFGKIEGRLQHLEKHATQAN
jgi:hypothetical protein